MSVADTAAELAPGQALKIRDIEVQGAQDALAARVKPPASTTWMKTSMACSLFT